MANTANPQRFPLFWALALVVATAIVFAMGTGLATVLAGLTPANAVLSGGAGFASSMMVGPAVLRLVKEQP
ncbi:hypothetical protein [Rhodococcus koreensis]